MFRNIFYMLVLIGTALVSPMFADTTVPTTITSLEPDTTSEVTTLEPKTTSLEPETSEPTTNPMTTESTASTLSTPKPEKEKFVVKEPDGTVCVVLKGNFTFSISYAQEGGETGVKSFTVPTDGSASVQGSCNSDADSVIVTFNKKWIMSLFIANKSVALEAMEGDQLAEEYTIFYWRTLTLLYFLDDTNFPDAEAPQDDPITITADLPADAFSASSAGSYQCAPSQRLTMNNETDLSVTISDLQYRAFGTTDAEDFSDDNVSSCSSPKKEDDDDHTVAIALGSVFGGLALIGLVAFVVYWNRRGRGNYEAV